MFLVERYFSHSHMKEINDISESINYMLNYDFNGEFSLNQEIIEDGKIDLNFANKISQICVSKRTFC